jgi:hypothetical protein
VCDEARRDIFIIQVESSAVLKEDISHSHRNKNAELKDTFYTPKYLEDCIARYIRGSLTWRPGNMNSQRTSIWILVVRILPPLPPPDEPKRDAKHGKKCESNGGRGERWQRERKSEWRGRLSAVRRKGAGKLKVCFFCNMEIRNKQGFAREAGTNAHSSA